MNDSSRHTGIVTLPFHYQQDPPGRVFHWASVLSECSPVWRLSGRCCDSWSCAHSCLKIRKTNIWSQCIPLKTTTIVAKENDGGGVLVTATCLLDLPSSMVSMTSSGLQTNLSVQPFQDRSRTRVNFWSRLWQIPVTNLSSHLHVGYSVLVFVHW